MSLRTKLVARTVDLDPSQRVDLLAFAGADGVLWWQGEGGLATRGEALRVELPRGLSDAAGAACAVRDALASIDVADDVRRPATGPIAIGALPFDPAGPASFVVHDLVVGRSLDRRKWLTTI
jgi:menaquinone-specific isochorismate synthase